MLELFMIGAALWPFETAMAAGLAFALVAGCYHVKTEWHAGDDPDT